MRAEYITEEKRPFLVKFEEVELAEGKTLPKGAIMRVRGLAHRAGRVTSNGTLYRPSLYKSESARLGRHMEDGKVLMYPRHPRRKDDGTLEPMSPSEATGLMRGLEVMENQDGTADVFITADLGDTTKGRDIAALVRMGGRIPISSRAVGSVNRVRLSDRHPFAGVNAEWIGKEVREIGEDFRLNTFDFVSEAASGGSETIDFQEEKETVMDFDVGKLTEEQWKEIAESDKVKAMIEAAVKAREEELNKEFDEKLVKAVSERADELLKSDEFAEAVKKAAGDQDDKNVTEEKCPECGASMKKGAKFCSACGAKMEQAAPPKNEGNQDDKDAKIEELTKKLDEMGETIKKLSARNEQHDNEKAFAAKLEAKLAGKPESVQRNVREALSDQEITLEEADKVIDGKIQLVENIFKQSGIDPATLPGKGVITEDTDDKGDKPHLTEAQKAQIKRMPRP